MATSNLQPISSADEKSLWYMHTEGTTLGASVFPNQSLLKGTPIAVGANTRSTIVSFYENTSSSTPFQTVTTSYDGQVKSIVLSSNCQVVTVSNSRGQSAIVSILKQESEQASNPIMTVITSTTNTLSLSGSGYALIVGAGGGGGAARMAYQSPNQLSPGGGGGSGGVQVQYFADLSTITSATIGAGGGVGTFTYNTPVPASGSGGATNFGGFTSNGGTAGRTDGNGTPAPGGSPGGAAGVGTLWASWSDNVSIGPNSTISDIALTPGTSISGGSRGAFNWNWDANFYNNFAFTKNSYASIGDAGDKNVGPSGYGYGGNGMSVFRYGPNTPEVTTRTITGGGSGCVIIMRSA